MFCKTNKRSSKFWVIFFFAFWLKKLIEVNVNSHCFTIRKYILSIDARQLLVIVYITTWKTLKWCSSDQCWFEMVLSVGQPWSLPQPQVPNPWPEEFRLYWKTRSDNNLLILNVIREWKFVVLFFFPMGANNGNFYSTNMPRLNMKYRTA